MVTHISESSYRRVGQPGSVIVARRCAHPVTLTRIAGSRKVCRISFHTHVQHVTCPASNDKIGFSKTRGRRGLCSWKGLGMHAVDQRAGRAIDHDEERTRNRQDVQTGGGFPYC